jgi:ABC-type transport system involved in Fe-S cluster assembly fused permease/ATPase subunit
MIFELTRPFCQRLIRLFSKIIQIVSGGGKSTTVKMLERFYDPTSGSVKLDGVDIKDINLKHLRSLIGYVGQEPTLFATSIANNIKYGNPSATQEQIEEAAKLANAHDFIASFPDGYSTQVGDKGAQLSGGESKILECQLNSLLANKIRITPHNFLLFVSNRAKTENCDCSRAGGQPHYPSFGRSNKVSHQ